ncbi:hypothetical protein ACFWV1_26005 [Streptomyces sp. NPDC058700]|uniref:hypothetical protein n=1 Tax=Streptomyces sp. NPDC058700 TaxID=3346607 RepID=UPI0036668732
MKTNSEPPVGHIIIQPGPGPYDRECADIVRVIEHALDSDETITIHNGRPGNVQAVRDLHQRQPDADYCDVCSNHGDITWPCATIRALDGIEK